jgi:uncharacterized protein YndB with AHSA1/START domain
VTAAEPRALVVRRVIQAHAETLFDAWLDPASLSQWMTPGLAVGATVSIDARIGGEFEIVMHLPGSDVPHRGQYLAMDRPRHLAFTWESPATGYQMTQVTVDFLGGNGYTEVVVTQRALANEEMVLSHRAGWTEILALLDQEIARAHLP